MASTTDVVKAEVEKATDEFVAALDKKTIHQSASHGELREFTSVPKRPISTVLDNATDLVDVIFRSRASTNSEEDSSNDGGNKAELIPAPLEVKSPHGRKVSSLYSASSKENLQGHKRSISLSDATEKFHDLNIKEPPPKNPKRRARSASSLIDENFQKASATDQTQHWPTNSALFDELRDIESKSPYSISFSDSDQVTRGGEQTSGANLYSSEPMEGVEVEPKEEHTMNSQSVVRPLDTTDGLSSPTKTGFKEKTFERAITPLFKNKSSHNIAGQGRVSYTTNLPTPMEDNVRENAVEYSMNPPPTAIASAANLPIILARNGHNSHHSRGSSIAMEAPEPSAQMSERKTTKKSKNAKAKAKSSSSTKGKNKSKSKHKGKKRAPTSPSDSSSSEYDAPSSDSESQREDDESKYSNDSDLDEDDIWYDRTTAKYEVQMEELQKEEQALLFRQKQLAIAMQAWAEVGAERESQRGVKRIKTAASKAKLEEEKIRERERHLNDVVGRLRDVMGMIEEGDSDEDAGEGHGASKRDEDAMQE